VGIRDFRKFFVDEQEEEASEARELAQMFSEWASCHYYRRFIDWLDEQATSAVDVTASHLDLVKSVTRANTFREIRKHLARVEADAKTALELSRGE